MLTITPPSIKSGHLASQQFMYDNALAVFGLVPMLALTVLYNNNNMYEKMIFCKEALFRFKNDKKFIDKVTSNLSVINGNKPVMINDLDIMDITLRELGYYEQYNKKRLESEVQQLINFLEIGV